MSQNYPLISPDIDSNGPEIASLVGLLSSSEALPNIAYRVVEGGPLDLLGREFVTFLTESTSSQSSFLQRFAQEENLKDTNVYATCLSSATSGLYALLTALGVAGGEVITASLNYIGVPNAIVMAGATPRFVDVDERSWCMDPESTEKALTKKTRAVILTHLNCFADIEPFYDLLKRKGSAIPLIQDASLAIGSTCRSLRPGLVNIGHGGATVFSLATSKIISGLGGGIVAASDVSLLNRVFSIAHQGMSLTNPAMLEFHGANMKMNDMNAVIALEQLRKRERIFLRRRELKRLYDTLLAPAVAEGKMTLQEVGEEAVVTHYAILIKDRDRVARALYEKYHIELGMWFINHRQALYQGCAGVLPRTDALDGKLTFLPFHTKLSDEDVSFICRVLLEELEHR